jgi:hypothetical protein
VKEYGATLTLSHKVNPKHVPFGGLGIARGDNKNSISHYTPYSTTKLTTNYQINVVTSVETGVQLRF